MQNEYINDKELREKVAKILFGGNNLLTWESCNNKADQILALLQPKIEEARKKIRAELNAEISIELGSKAFNKGKILGARQERERILGIVTKELENRELIVHTHPLHGVDVCPMCLFVGTIRRALKE